jgi:hypothetical protein
MSGDEDSQGSAEQEVHDTVREEVRKVVEDNGEGGYATQRVKLVEAPGSLSWRGFVSRCMVRPSIAWTIAREDWVLVF